MFPCRGEAGLHVQAVIDAIYQSGMTGGAHTSSLFRTIAINAIFSPSKKASSDERQCTKKYLVKT